MDQVLTHDDEHLHSIYKIDLDILKKHWAK